MLCLAAKKQFESIEDLGWEDTERRNKSLAYFGIFHKDILIEGTSIHLKFSISSASKLVGRGLKKYLKIISFLTIFYKD